MWIHIEEDGFAPGTWGGRAPYEYRVGNHAIVAIGVTEYSPKGYAVWTVRKLRAPIAEREPPTVQTFGGNWDKALEVFNEQIRIVSAELAVQALDLNNEQA